MEINSQKTAVRGDSHLLFRRGLGTFYIPTLSTVEIGRIGPVTQWSEKSDFLKGTAIIHGKSELVVDIHPLLLPNSSPLDQNDEQLVVCIRSAETMLCLMIDEIIALEMLFKNAVKEVSTPLISGFHSKGNSISIPILNTAGICGSVCP